MDINNLFEKYSHANALETMGKKLTYEEYFLCIKSISNVLISNNIQKGDIVLIADLALFQFPALLFAIWSIGAIAFPVNPKLTPKELENAYLLSKPKFVISKKKITYIPCKWINPNSFKKPIVQNGNKFTWDLNIPATIIQTSGSSGLPKLAVHSLKNHFANALAVNSFFKTSTKDSWLLALPLYHVAGLALIFRCFLNGAVLSIPDGHAALEEYLLTHNPSHISLVPAQLWKLLENQAAVASLKRCKAVFVGGSSVPSSLIEKGLEQDLNLFTSYGLTEAASTVAIKKISDVSSAEATILPGYNLKINNEGTVLIKGDSLFMGYYANGTIKKDMNEKNWFDTKDLGKIENSKVTILGRKDNMFISGGENIYPEEIEKELLDIKGVRHAIVVPKSDSRFGQRPIAFIEMDFPISESELKNKLRKNLQPYKIPDMFLPWPVLAEKENIKIERSYFKSLI